MTDQTKDYLEWIVKLATWRPGMNAGYQMGRILAVAQTALLEVDPDYNPLLGPTKADTPK